MSTSNRLFERFPDEVQLQLEQSIREFDRAWRRGERPKIVDYLPSDKLRRHAVLIELVHTELEYRLKAGEPARVEVYLRRYPELQRDETVVVDLIVSEYELRARHLGPAPLLMNYVERFPQYRAHLSSHFQAVTPGLERLSPSSNLTSHATPRVSDDDTETSSPLVPQLSEATSSRTTDATSGPIPLPPHGPSRFGRFQLLETVGEGSFGTVYKAVDTQLDRVVALKIPRMGRLATQEEGGRFLREARSAARLKHPLIVPVHDVGQIDGMCYLVSDLIVGVTLAEQLRIGALDFCQAAELIAQAADALHYAHEHGVIHRDIKPSNIILDAKGQPNVMDFGLARRESGDSTLTVEGQLLGTPAYISPEQAQGDAHKVDGRSDIYSLGAILYELIAGQLPFSGNSRMVMLQVLHDEPRPPRRLNDEISRDLETICLKAMAKEPGKRYQTAGELAADLRRFLAGEPVRARPVGPSAKLFRWCRRKPFVASLSATLVLALAGGFGGITWQWRRAESERRRAEENFQQAHQGVREFYTILDKDVRYSTPSFMPLNRAVLEVSLKYYQRLLPQRADDPALRADIAVTYYRLAFIAKRTGSLSEALKSYRTALGMWKKLVHDKPDFSEFQHYLAKTYKNMGLLLEETGNSAEASSFIHQSHKIREQMVQENPTDGNQNELAYTYYHIAVLQNERGQLADALHSLGQASRIRERLFRQDPTMPDYGRRLATVYCLIGDVQLKADRPVQASRMYHNAREVGEKLVRQNVGMPESSRGLAWTYYALGILKSRMGESSTDALDFHQKACDVRQQLVRDNPTVSGLRRELASSYMQLGKLQEADGSVSQAIVYYEKAIEIRERLVAQSPTLVAIRRSLADSYMAIGRLQEADGQIARAQESYQKARQIRNEQVVP